MSGTVLGRVTYTAQRASKAGCRTLLLPHERERDASACMRRHQAFALAPVRCCCLIPPPASPHCLVGSARSIAILHVMNWL